MKVGMNEWKYASHTHRRPPNERMNIFPAAAFSAARYPCPPVLAEDEELAQGVWSGGGWLGADGGEVFFSEPRQ